MENQGSYSRNTDDTKSARFFGRQGGCTLLLATFLLFAGPRHLRAAIGASASQGVLSFNPAPVGIAEASAQQLTATFDVSGYTGTFTPTATLHYGYDYSAGAVDCTGGPSPETCTVTITFQPTLPGGRKDALFLMNGPTRLATVLLYGIGQAPLALVQPGVVNSTTPSTNYLYQSVVDGNGTLYVLGSNSNTVISVTKGGVVAAVPITGLSSPRTIGIDGAGVLYIHGDTYDNIIVTYDTVQAVQGTFGLPATQYFDTVDAGNTGNVYALAIGTGNLYTIIPGGTYTTTALSPAITQPYTMTVDSAEDVFIGGYTINEITAGGTQSEINTVGASAGIAVDAADTVYATRYTGSGGVVELAASEYGTELAALDTSASPLGVCVGSDGTVFVSNYSTLDTVDRSQGAIAFGEQFVGTTSTAQDVGIYNGGNESLTLSNIALTGSAFAMQPAATNGCTGSTVLAPGALCQVAVTMTAPHAGTFSGTITFTSNSLNTTSTENTVALSGFAYGVYVTASPSALPFGPQITGTTSAAQMVTLTNQGDLYSAGIGSPSSTPSGFNVGMGTCTSSVAVGSSCQLSVTFKPTAVQPYSGTVTIPVSSTGGGSWPSATFTVSGSGVPPTPTAGVSPQGLTFNNQGVGTTSAPQPVTLSNMGGAALAIANIAASSNFGQTNNCGGSVAASGSCTINVTFSPTATGTLTGMLTITDNNNGVTGSTQMVNLSGTGINPIVHWPGPIVLPPPPSVPVPGRSPLPPAVPLPLPPSGTGTEPVVRSPGPTILPLAPPSLPVPAASFSATLSVAGNASGSPHTAFFTGTGVSFVSDVGTATAAQAMTVNFTTAGTLSSIQVFTLGAANLDFTQASGGTCATGTAYTAGESCTVNVIFTPEYAGTRDGSVLLTDGSGNVLGTTYLPGTGLGPQIVFGPGIQTSPVTLNENYIPTGVAADGAGNLYFATSNFNSGTYGVFKLPKSGSGYGPPVAIGSGYNSPQGVAVDGSGNVYVGDYANYRVVKIPWTGSGYGAQTTVPLDAKPFREPRQVAVDSLGNVYFADYGYSTVVEVPWTGSGYGTLVTLPFTGLNSPNGVAVDGDGNVFCGDSYNHRVIELPWTVSGYGAPVTVATLAATDLAFFLAIDGSGDIYVSEQYQNVTGGAVLQIPWTGSAYGAPVNLNVAGLGYAPEGVAVDGAGNVVVGGGVNGTVFRLDRADAPSLSFANTNVGSTSSDSPRTVAVENIGNASLTFSTPGSGSNPNYPLNFPVNSSDTGLCAPGTPLTESASCDVSVNFKPTAAGNLTGNVVLTNNDLNGANVTQSISVNGTGTGAAAPVASLSASSLSFGNQLVGTTSASQTVTLNNTTGTAALTIASIAASANFGVTSGAGACGSSLAVGGSCTIDVTFTPTATGSLTGTLTITDNNNGVTGSMQTVTLSGTGINPIVHWPGPIVLPPPPSVPVPGRPPMPPTVPPTRISGGTGTEPVVRSPGPTVLSPPPPSLPAPGQPAPPPTVPPTGNLSETGKKDGVRSPGLSELPLWPPSHPFRLQPVL